MTTRTTAIAIVSLLLSGCAPENPPTRDHQAATAKSGLMLTVEYYGVETRTWYRAGFATVDRQGALTKWREGCGLLREFCLTSVISFDEANKLRVFFASKDMVALRSNEPPNGRTQHYVVNVYDGVQRYYMSIGLGKGTLRIIREIESELDESPSHILRPMDEQLSYFVAGRAEDKQY